MGLEKAIQYGKEHRQPYRGSKAWDSHCRNHNACDYCRNNRLHADQVREYSAREEPLDWELDQSLYPEWFELDGVAE